MSTLIICRHGNTFSAGERPRRIGLKTDLPLTEEGFIQAENLGVYLAEKNLIPSTVYCSTLRRTRQTAQRIMDVMDVHCEIGESTLFNEIDYGPDEACTEEEVRARIGQEAIELWDKEAVVPSGWIVDPDALKDGWREFAERLQKIDGDEVTLVVTSNGAARFSPYITGDFPAFCRAYNIKLKTGALGIFIFDGTGWQVMEWNKRPGA